MNKRNVDANNFHEEQIMGVKHSGQLGDIIYSIPAVKELLAKHAFDKVVYFIPNDTRIEPTSAMKHFGGDFIVNPAMFEFIKPLLMEIPIIHDVIYLPSNQIPNGVIDLDSFRKSGINLAAGNIRDYFFKSNSLLSTNNTPWIRIKKNKLTTGIVIGRSTRYFNESINYNLLNEFNKEIKFIGSKNEFQFFTSNYNNINVKHEYLKNAHEAAILINSAEVYIGNQSLFFSIAEGMQAPRILESYEPVPNVVPNGGICGSFTNTRSMMELISRIFNTETNYSNIQQMDPHYILSI